MGFRVCQIYFSYKNREIIKDISLLLDPGYFYGIVGPNGCGKTTFIDLLMGHKRVARGTICYKGREILSYSKKELARETALVPQNFYSDFPFNAGEIVMMGRYPYIPRFSPPSAHDAEIVTRVMQFTGTEKFRYRSMTELSGGERQRVVFARALAQDTPVLMLDEATSNLDIRHTLNLFDRLSEDVREKKKTVIAVIQDINLAATYCDRMIFMKEGMIAAFGETAQVLRPEIIKKVFDVESTVYFDPCSDSLKVGFKRNQAIISA